MSASRNGKSKSGAVRIIGGSWRRHRIAVPSGGQLRPTPDRVRETLFNWLNPFLPGARCLDLYAGTGVLGFEALSRGARSAVLVERDLTAAEALEDVRETLGANAEVVGGEAVAYLQRSAVGPFDIVFVDPPYSDAVTPVFQWLVPVLAPDARVYLERLRGERWPDLPDTAWSRRATAGNVEFGLAERTR